MPSFVRARRAFTLVELLVVILVLGVLLAIALPLLGNSQNSAKDAKAKSILSAAYKGIKVAAASNEGNYPTGTDLTAAIDAAQPGTSSLVTVCPASDANEVTMTSTSDSGTSFLLTATRATGAYSIAPGACSGGGGGGSVQSICESDWGGTYGTDAGGYSGSGTVVWRCTDGPTETMEQVNAGIFPLISACTTAGYSWALGSPPVLGPGEKQTIYCVDGGGGGGGAANVSISHTCSGSTATFTWTASNIPDGTSAVVFRHYSDGSWVEWSLGYTVTFQSNQLHYEWPGGGSGTWTEIGLNTAVGAYDPGVAVDGIRIQTAGQNFDDISPGGAC